MHRNPHRLTGLLHVYIHRVRRCFLVIENSTTYLLFEAFFRLRIHFPPPRTERSSYVLTTVRSDSAAPVAHAAGRLPSALFRLEDDSVLSIDGRRLVQSG